MAWMTASLRAVWRGVRRSPGFTIGVVALLALGLGVNAMTFGLVDRLVLRGPSGIQHANELRRVVVHRKGRSGATMATTELGYLDYRDLLAARTLAGAAAETSSPLLFGSGDSAERIQGRFVTAGYFPLLGARPAIGRFFSADESEREGARLVVLSHAFWQRRFAADPAVLGRELEIESHRYEIVGVAPRAFTGTAVTRVDVFLPLEAAADEQVDGPWRSSRKFYWIQAVVRLAAGTPDATVETEITARMRQAYAEVTDADHEPRLELAPLNALRGVTAVGDLSVAALVGGVALLVLLIAFANVANLFLARALRQRDRLAVRLALGGGRARLIAEQASEGALLALVGAGAALLLALVGAAPARRLLFPQVEWLEGSIDRFQLLFLAGAAVLGGAVAGALPIWQTRRADLSRLLKSGGERVSRTRAQGAMLVVQGALSVLLLVGAGLFVRTLTRVEAFDLGVDADRLLVVSALPGTVPPAEGFREELRDSIEKIPGVARTTRVAGTLPFVSSWAERLEVPGLAERPRVADGGPYLAAVEPGYFEAMGTAIVDGRGFGADDREGSERVVVVNRSMARLYWPGENPLGKCLRIGDADAPCSRVVGVAANTRRQEVVEGESLLYYVPIEQAPEDLRRGRLVLRAADNDAVVLARIAETARRRALEIAPGLRYVAVRPLDEIVAPQLRAWRLGAGLFGLFGVLALGVSAVGLYSVVAFDVEGRRREIGVRAALGATRADLLRWILGDGLRLAAGGLLLGLAAAWLLAPLLDGLLVDGSPHDGGVFLGVGFVLAGAALLASFVPALRAARLDPGRVLREE